MKRNYTMNQIYKQSFQKLENIKRKFLKFYFFENLIISNVYKKKEEISKNHYKMRIEAKIFDCFQNFLKVKILQKQVFFSKVNLFIYFNRNFKSF